MTAEILNPEAGEIVEQFTASQAKIATERIRVALDNVSTAWADLSDRIAEAYQRRADLALGYDSWAAYAETELKPSGAIAAEVRRELVAKLSAQGMSTRAIAPTVGVSQKTVDRDSRNQVSQGDSPGADAEPSLDDNEQAAVEAGGTVTKTTVTKITGIDGKSYTKQESSPPRRKPLRDGFRDAALDLDKVVRRFQKLVADDRFSRNKNEVTRYRNDLARANEALQRLIDQF